MTVKTTRVNEDGVNAEGKAWSLSLEMPSFDVESINNFYEKLVLRIKQKCENEGIKTMSHLSITTATENFVSLYIDLLFLNKRELIGLHRICDNRLDNGLCMLPKGKAKSKRFDGFYIRGDKTVSVKTVLPKNTEGIRSRDYLSYIEETVF